jgi:hypothetical protein
MDGRSAQGRRLKELVEIYSRDIEPLDEQTEAMVRASAMMALQLERLEERITRGEDIDEERMQRLTNSLARRTDKLDRMKAKSSPAESSSSSGVSALQRHLEKLAAQAEE